MDPTVCPSSALLLMLGDLVAGDWNLATVHLFMNDVDPGLSAVTGDFTEATFTGSTAIAMGAFGQAYLTPQGFAEAVATLLQWNWTAGGSETIYGVYVLSAGGGTPLIAYARFVEPKVMATANDSIALVPRLRCSPTGFGTFAPLAP